MEQILAVADLMGVSIEWEDFLPLGWAGAYWAAAHTVYILRGMGMARTRSVLAHELGHARLGHTGRTTADEWQADVWGAQLLISREEWAAAVMDDPPIEVVARRLDVTEHMVRVRAREARGLQHFMDHQPYKLAHGVPATRMAVNRGLEPRRLTRLVPVVPAPAPRVTVAPIPERELVPA